MLLAVDVRNDVTVLGLMDGDVVAHTMRITTTPRTTDELGLLLLGLLGHRGARPSDVDGAIACSVVPDRNYSLDKALRRYLDVPCRFVGRDKLKTGMRLRIDNPREVGADRVVNAVGAAARWGAPVVVVDLGTATTIDCVDGRGDYVGGVIAQGLRASEEALVATAAQLPRVELTCPTTVIGRSTVHSMQSGLIYGHAGMVDALVDRCRVELAPEARVVATGSFATLLGPVSTRIQEVDPWLTLHGLALIAARNG
ncbi:MAG: type III pantothenate kinase [Alphaproteobacteria bacterium]|nr:type III pantothenate kinase [Alphaproteobacteria bacterium]MCB9696602.1 type III pantothenate kinase [Alphaproteobacteria bacterium]